MDGIVFFRTERLADVVDFYTDRVGATVWKEQPDCTILGAGDFRFGFCERVEADTAGIVTFVVEDRDAVDEAYAALEAVAEEPPAYSDRYEIYKCASRVLPGFGLEDKADTAFTFTLLSTSF